MTIARLSAAALAACIVASAAEAETWRQATRAEIGSDFIDTDSIRRTGTNVRYSRETRYLVPQRLPDERSFDTIAIDYVADCARRTHRPLRTTVRLKGVTLLSYSAEEAGGEQDDVARPGTIAASVLNAVCDGRWNF